MLRAPAVDESVLAGLRSFGATESQLQQVRNAARLQAAERAEPVWEIWEQNWPTWEFFLALSTQWERATLVHGHGRATWSESIRIGLPSPRVESTARLRGLPRSRWPEVFADIQRMERAVLKADEERRRDG